MNQFALLLQRRFAAIFWTQFVGAFTDGFYKNALVILVMFGGFSLPGYGEEQLNYVAAALFILPFFVLSATAGQLADKHEKAELVRLLKALEIGFSVLAALGMYLHNVPILLMVLVLFAIQSTFFGPIKYGILPQLLHEEELVGGNGMVEMATQLAILAGTILSEVVYQNLGTPGLSVLLLGMSVVGFGCSRFIPRTEAAAPELQVNLNPIPPTLELFGLIGRNRAVLNSILGISWFWFLGSALLSVFPVYARETLQGTPAVFTLLLAVFSIGVAVGSLWCERLSYGRLELGLVPLGSIGISVFCLDLYLVGVPSGYHAGMGPFDVLHQWSGIRICADIFLLAMFSGFFLVPLYTLIQQRTEAAVRSRVIAANNVVNAAFMVASSIVLLVLRSKFELTLPGVFAVMCLLNAAVALYIYTLLPEFFLRFCAYLIAHVLYRLRVRAMDHIPEEGPVILVCNHVSFADWLIVAAGVRRPVHFVMWHAYAQLPLLRFIFRDAGVIPIAPAKVNQTILDRAYARIKECLDAGEVVCLFPEGKITPDGEICEFKTGIEKIVAENHKPVVPMALRGLWGSNFSHYRGGCLTRFLRRPLKSPIELVAAPMILPEDVHVADLQRKVEELRGDRK